MAQEIVEAGMLGRFREIGLQSTGELVIKVCKGLRLPVFCYTIIIGRLERKGIRTVSDH